MRGASRRWVGLGMLGVLALAAGCGGPSKSGQVEPTPTPTPTPTPMPSPTSSPVGFQFGTPGPWPVQNVTYGAADGIAEAPVVALTTDESQNRWLATPEALYLLRPGEKSFHRYDEKDGLHLHANQAHYCNDRQVPVTQRCTSTEMWGSGLAITTLVGGGADEVFVGYAGDHTPNMDCANNGDGQDWCDPLKHTGKIDRVKLAADGSVTVDRLDLLSNNHGALYWHNRTIMRLAYDHFVHAHTLYAGCEHGVDLLFPDAFRLPNPGEWYDTAYSEWMADHLHARVCFEKACDNTGANQRMGEWRGLAVDGNGDLWHAGKWSAGLITWDAAAKDWYGRNGLAYKHAFGDPYGGPGTPNPPVFQVPKEGHDVFLSAVAVCPDGKVWFSTLGAEGVAESLASFEEGHGFQYVLASTVGLPDTSVKDLVCLPDGRLAVASATSGLVLWNPATGAHTAIRASSGLIPDDAVQALEVDRMPSPPTLHVSTASGAAAIRVPPP